MGGSAIDITAGLVPKKLPGTLAPQMATAPAPAPQDAIDISAGLVPIDISAGLVPKASSAPPAAAPGTPTGTGSDTLDRIGGAIRGLLSKGMQAEQDRPGETAIGRFAHGIGRAGIGMAELPFQVKDAYTLPPQSPDEQAIVDQIRKGQEGGQPAPAAEAEALAEHRLILGPAKQEWQAARDDWQQARQGQAAPGQTVGRLAGAGVHALAAAVPGVGPFVGGALSEAEKGNVAGAGGELASGWAIGEAGDLARSGIRAGRGAIADAMSRGEAAPAAGGLAERMNTPPASATPAEQVTRAEMYEAAKQHGIDLPPAAVSGSNALQQIETLGKRSLVGGGGLLTKIEDARRGVLDWQAQMAADLDRRGVANDTESVGKDLKDQAENRFQAEQRTVSDAYQREMAPLESRINDVDVGPLHDWAFGERFERTADGKLLPVAHSPEVVKALDEGLNPMGSVIRAGARAPGDRVVSVQTLPRTGSRGQLGAAVATGERIPGEDGSGGVLKTPGGDYSYGYRVVEAGQLKPSHNPNTFAITPGYPEGVQERAYHTSKEAQSRVIDQAQRYDPAFTIASDPTAVNGPPVITQDGTVLGGNSRAMSTMRLYSEGRGDVYRSKLMDEAHLFGVDPKQVAGMKQPVLVRELGQVPATVDDARRLGSDLNRSFTGALGVNERAVSAGRSITNNSLQQISSMADQIGPDATIRDVLNKRPQDVLALLQRDGVITDRERPQFVDSSTGALTDEAKRFTERALLGSVVDDVGLLDRAPAGALSKVGASLSDLSKLTARSDEWNISPIVRGALGEYADMQARGLDLQTALAQRAMFGERNPAVGAMMKLLAERPGDVKATIGQFARDAATDVPGQGSLGLFQKPEAWRTFNELLGADLTPEQYRAALEPAVNGEASNGRISSTAEGAVSATGASEGQPNSGVALSGGTVPPETAGGSGSPQPRPGAGAEAQGATFGKPQPLTWRSAVARRSHYFDGGNSGFQGRLAPHEVATWKRMTALLDDAMEKSAGAAGGDVLATWRRANALYKQLHEDWEGMGSLLSPLINKAHPVPDVKIPDSLLQSGSYGGDPAKIRALKSKGLDLGPLQAELLNRIRDANFRVARGKLAGYSDDFLRELLPSNVVDDLYKMGAVARALRFESNPSGTGAFLSGERQLLDVGKVAASPALGLLTGASMAHPVVGATVGLAVPYAAAKIAGSPRLAGYLARRGVSRAGAISRAMERGSRGRLAAAARPGSAE